jgi:hypothetical protein
MGRNRVEGRRARLSIQSPPASYSGQCTECRPSLLKKRGLFRQKEWSVISYPIPTNKLYLYTQSIPLEMCRKIKRKGLGGE